jgi:hypothetical protein
MVAVNEAALLGGATTAVPSAAQRSWPPAPSSPNTKLPLTIARPPM